MFSPETQSKVRVALVTQSLFRQPDFSTIARLCFLILLKLQMANRLVPILRRSAMASARSGGFITRGGPAPAPFARLAKPSRPLTEEHELIWDDGVAPETCIDFDVPNYTASEGRNWFASGLGFFAVLLGVVYFWDAPGRKRTTTRTMPFNGLKEELGGYDTPK